MKMKALVNAEICVKGEVLNGDIVLLDGKIFDVVDPGQYPKDKKNEIIDCKGKLILPGLIDVACGSSELETALSAGVTLQLAGDSFGSKTKIVSDWSDGEIEKLCKGLSEGEKLHFSRVSKGADVDLINQYRDKGVTCDVALHSLVLNEDDKDYIDDFVGSKPALGERQELFALWKSLKFAEIDMIVSGHESFFPAVEWLLPILLNAANDEGLTIAEVVKLACEKPAEIFGIKNKGKIEVGYDADLVIVDMELERKVEREDLFTKCGWSPYEGSVFKGWPVKVFVNGELSFSDGKVLGKPKGKEVEFA
jgi:dihydroorotase-like cyclic amidohydrolase